jgi:antagonist of KipI
MSIHVVRSGILDTIQDNGRHGYGKWGINPSGAMDGYAAQVANALTGNTLREAVIELHFPSGEFHFDEDALISLAGADFTPVINSKAVPVWQAMIVKKNSVLSFQRRREGYRCYMAVRGGLKIPSWLGSMSTNIKVPAGGFNDRPLKKGDRLDLRQEQSDVKTQEDIRILPWRVNVHPVYSDPGSIFFMEGREWDWLTPESRQRMLSGTFRIEPSSDRMGSYLQHEPLKLQHQEELLSSAVGYGTMQLLPAGKLVVLMADHQTTGGYPRIGHVATAHLPKLSQLAPHQAFCFRKITVADAEKMLFSLQQDLRRVQQGCLENLSHYDAQH